jgi:glycosyltransferase involved in cell wall biosynthesis
MVTRGPLYPARFAIECFRAQGYENRELVIVCDDPAAPLRDYVISLGDPKIRYIEPGQASLGELRNVSVAEAGGELICQWDDDDLYHPDRLEYQAGGLLESGVAAHFLGRWTMWWPSRRTLALSEVRPWEGTMLARREAVGEYPAQSRSEDFVMVKELVENNTIVVADAPEHYLYVVHGGNTWGEKHFERLFENATWTFSDYETELARRAGHLPIRDYLRSLEGSRDAALVYSGATFGNQRLTLDGTQFRQCRFDGTVLGYDGGDLPVFDGCSFHNVQFDFNGPAGDTFALLRWLIDQGIIAGMTRAEAG